jgi:hypothetical protein
MNFLEKIDNGLYRLTDNITEINSYISSHSPNQLLEKLCTEVGMREDFIYYRSVITELGLHSTFWDLPGIVNDPSRLIDFCKAFVHAEQRISAYDEQKQRISAH